MLKLAAYNEDTIFPRPQVDLKLEPVALKSLSSNREVIHVSSKLAKAIDGMQSHLEATSYYEKQSHAMKLESMGLSPKKRFRGSELGLEEERYQTNIKDLIEVMEQNAEQERVAARRRRQAAK